MVLAQNQLPGGSRDVHIRKKKKKEEENLGFTIKSERE